ncbi:MAG: pectate lyase-like adhesive domain-containing protein, partial [Lactobacillus panisapium]
MLGKNNYKERLKRMEMQSKQDHFSIRKLSIGAASVLLGFTFFGLNSQTAKADTVDSKQEVSENVNTKSVQSSSISSGKKTETQDTQSDATKENDSKLSTFTGLTSFFKGTDKVTVKNDNSNNNQSLSNSSEKQSLAEKDNQIANSTKKQATDQKNSDQSQSSALTKSSQSNASDITGSTDVKDDTSKLMANSTANQEKADELTGSDNPNLAVTDQEQKVQTRADDNTTGSIPTIINGAAYIYTWAQLKTAYGSADVSKIYIMKDIAADTGTDTQDEISTPARRLLITSGGNTRHIIDFQGSHPVLVNSNNQLRITYQNLQIWSSDYFGIIKTDVLNYDAARDNKAVITLDDIDFHGSQMLYVGNHNEIHLKNNITAETVNNNYTSPVDGTVPTGGGNNQQLFEFTGGNNTITFEQHCTFTGSTYDGNVIEMRGTDCSVTVAKDATVTLNPLYNKDSLGGGSDSGENTDGVCHGIYTESSGKVDVEGTLNINVGKNPKLNYNGLPNNARAKAISLKGNSLFNIGSGGSVNISTNGNISSGNGNNNLVYDGGNFIINPNGSLIITGEDMGNYSSTLVAIAGSADVENGTFEIRLKNGGSTGAGNQPITLIDVTGTNSTLTVNNPKSLVLDAHLNTNPSTSIIGNNQVTISNVRQKLDLTDAGIGKITLPPYHLLKVSKTNGKITVAPNGIELLNGQQVFNNDTLAKIMADDQLKTIFNKLPKEFLTVLQDAANQGITYDDLFSKIINFAFNDSSHMGYNDISFIPANPSGFLDINPADVKVSYNADGSSTISGSILNYTDENDGPSSDGIFSKILPGGTHAYVRAYIRDLSDTETAIAPDPNSNVDDPYADTAEAADAASSDKLPHEFTTVAKLNKDTGRYEFSFTIPKDSTNELVKGYKVVLYPNANFIEYNPLATKLLETDLNHRPIAVDVLTAAQDTAAKAINDKIKEINDAGLVVISDDLKNAIANAKQVAATSDSSNYDSQSSVYGAETIAEVNSRKNNALNKLINAYNDAQKVSGAINNAITNSGEAIENAAKDAKRRVGNSGLTYDEQQIYIEAIENAKNAALAKKGDENFDPEKSIYGSTSVDDVTNRQTKATNIFNKEAAKGELDGFAKDCETILGLDSTNNKGVEDAKTAAITAIDKIADSAVPVADNTTDVNNSENDGKTNILDAVKAAAKDQLSNSNTSVQGAIDKIDGLSEKEKADYEAQAGALVTNDKKTGYADLIDQDPTAADIKGHLNDGIAALNELETKAKAIGRINDAATNAKAQIDQNKDLSDPQTYKDQIDSLVSEGTDAVNKAESAKIDTTAQEYIDQINNVPKTAGNDILNNQRNTAKQAVEAAAKIASDAISAISDDLLDPATKTKYNKQITDAENAAETAIDAATTANAITSAQNAGINNINDVSLSAEKASALTELATAKEKDLGLIDTARKDGSIDDQTAQTARDNINDIYNQAVVKITTKDNDIKTVDTDKTDAIQKMADIANNIKGSQAEQDLRKAKKNAIDELTESADKVKTEIANDKNLSQVEKDGYTAKVDQA